MHTVGTLAGAQAAEARRFWSPPVLLLGVPSPEAAAGLWTA
jgi:hypothetical protein